MYIRTNERLGEVVRGGDVRGVCITEVRRKDCDIDFKVAFRRSFADFLREVEGAYGRWMTGPRARTLVRKTQETLKKWHEEMLDQKVPDTAPVVLRGPIHYRRGRRPNGTWGTWRVVDISLDVGRWFDPKK